MNRFWVFFQRIYVYLIIALTYIPMMFALVWSFNSADDKGRINSAWGSFSTDAWKNFIRDTGSTAIINTILIALLVAIITVAISLITVYALWKQHNKTYEGFVRTTYNIPLINSDNITAIGLTIVYAGLFGSLSAFSEGVPRVIISHVVVSLPYAITLMYPISEKFSKNLFEASQDLGYSKFKTWFKTYFRHMLPSSVFSAIVAIFISFDDYIIVHVTSNVATLGTKIYEADFKPWGLVVGGVLMIVILLGNGIYILAKRKEWKWAK